MAGPWCSGEPFKPSRCIKASYYIPENRFNFPTTKGYKMNISMKLIDQYIAIFFNFSTTSNHLHPLQVENCDSNSRLVVDEDDNGKCRIERVKAACLESRRSRVRTLLWHSSFKDTKCLRDREVASSASDRHGSNFESSDWRAVSSHSSHHHQEVILAQFSLYVHKCELRTPFILFISIYDSLRDITSIMSWAVFSFFHTM